MTHLLTGVFTAHMVLLGYLAIRFSWEEFLITLPLPVSVWAVGYYFKVRATIFPLPFPTPSPLASLFRAYFGPLVFGRSREGD